MSDADPFPATTRAIEDADRQAEKLAMVRDYANGLRIWGAEATRDIANDILHIIEGDK